MATIDQLTHAAVISRDMNIPVSLFGQNLRISIGQLIDIVTAQPDKVKVQYSSDGEEWHDEYKDGDKWMRISQDNGETWGAPINIDAKDGQPGPEGMTYYTWIKYSDIAAPQFPSDIYDTPRESTLYMGLSFNRPTPVESNDPALYQWMRIRGIDPNSLTDVGEYYCAHDSSTVAPPIGLFIQAPPNPMPTMTKAKPYLWNFERTYFTDGTITQTQPALIGSLGDDGVGIQSVTNYYLASKRGSGVTKEDTAEERWTNKESEATVLFGEANPYLWNYEVITYTNLRQQATEPHIIGHWGGAGMTIDLDNEMDTVLCREDGTVTVGLPLTTTARMWEGTTELKFDELTATAPEGVEVSTDKETGIIKVTAIAASLEDKIIVKIEGKSGDYQGWRNFTIIKSRAPWIYNILSDPGVIAKGQTKTVSILLQRANGRTSETLKTLLSDLSLWISKDGASFEKTILNTPINVERVESSLLIHLCSGDTHNENEILDMETLPVIEKGAQGTSSFTSFVFKRSATKPSAPKGGSYLNPVPEGWDDGIPPVDKEGNPVWMSTRVFTSDGQVPQTDEWTDPQLVADTSDIDFEFSSVESNPGNPTDNPTRWHNDSTPDDIWMAVRKISNGVAGAWQISKIKGETGKPGTSGASSLTSFVFKRSAEQPDRPVGGSYADSVPAGWSDGIPAPDRNGWPVWMSSRVFTSDGQPPQEEKWSEPQMIADTNDIDFEFSEVEDNPGDPTKNPSNWHNDATENDIWMAIRKNSNGAWGEWQITKIKGESGNSSFESFVFKRSKTQPSKPSGGSYKNPVPQGWEDGIPDEKDGMPVWMSSRTFSSDGKWPQDDEWSEPMLMIDNETTDFEWSAVETNPGNPTTNPQNWHDPGTPDDWWMAMRKKTNGQWGDWNIMRIKGERGEAGKDTYILDLDNEMAGIPLDYEGKPVGTLPESNATVYKGPNIDSGWKFEISCNGCSAEINPTTGHIQVTGLMQDKAEIKVTASKEGLSSLHATMSLYGVQGGVVYSIEPNVNSISKYQDGTLSTNRITVTKYVTDGANPRKPTNNHWCRAIVYTDGKPGTEQTIAAAGTSTGTVEITPNVTAVEFILYDNSNGTTWQTVLDRERVPVVSDGKDGKVVSIESVSTTYAISKDSKQPDESAFTFKELQEAVTAAVKQKMPFIWTKTLTTYSDGKEVKGFAVMRLGTDGDNGVGIPGTSSYLHLAYADSVKWLAGKIASVVGFSTVFDENKKFIGQCVTESPEDPKEWESYEWSKYIGDSVTITSTSVMYAKGGKDGSQPLDSAFVYSSIPAIGTILGSYIWSRTRVNYSDGEYTITYGVFRIGEDGDEGLPGTPGANGKTPYLHFAYATEVSPNPPKIESDVKGFNLSAFDDAAYMGTYTDYEIKDSDDPLKYKWSKFGLTLSDRKAIVSETQKDVEATMAPLLNLNPASLILADNRSYTVRVYSSLDFKKITDIAPAIPVSSVGKISVTVGAIPSGGLQGVDVTVKTTNIQTVNIPDSITLDVTCGGEQFRLTLPYTIQHKFTVVNNAVVVNGEQISGSLKGEKGEDGDTWKPSVSSDGLLSWQKDSSTAQPGAVNIRGPQGNKGDKGDKGDTGATGKSIQASWNASLGQMTFTPVDSATAITINDLASKTTVDGLGTRLSTAEANITNQGTRLTTAENNIGKKLDSSQVSISNGVISIKGTTITPITSHQSLANYYTKAETEAQITNKGYITNAALSGYAKTADVTSLGTRVTNAESGIDAAKELAVAMATGKMLFEDPTFANGMNSASKYANSGIDNLTLTRIADSNAPNSSGYVIELKNTGLASPGLGGFGQSTQSKPNRVFIHRIVAKIPVGYSINPASNSTGEGRTITWLTPNMGTGKWAEYAYKHVCGEGGTFSSFGYIFLTGPTPTTSAPVTWYVAYATMFDLGQSNALTWGNLSSKPTTVAGLGLTDLSISGSVVKIGTSTVTVPTNTNQLTNGAGFQTASQVESALTPYAKTIDVNSALAGKASQSEVTNLGSRIDNLRNGGTNLIKSSKTGVSGGWGTDSSATASNTCTSVIDAVDSEGFNVTTITRNSVARPSTATLEYYWYRWMQGLLSTFPRGMICTFSLEYKSTASGVMWIDIRGSGVNKSEYRISLPSTEGEWKRAYIKCDWSNQTSTNYNSCLFAFGLIPTATSGQYISIRKFKLEEGNIGSDWSPSPFDMVSQADVNISGNSIKIGTASGTFATSEQFTSVNTALGNKLDSSQFTLNNIGGSIAYNDIRITGKPTIPTTVAQLTDAGQYAKTADVNSALAGKANTSDVVFTGQLSVTDFNSVPAQSGNWRTPNMTANCPNNQTGVWYYLEQIVNSTYRRQRVTIGNGTTAWIRYYYSSWSNWVQEPTLAEVNAKTTLAEVKGLGYQTSAQVESAITGKGYQTSAQVESAITGKGYQTSAQVESAITGKGYQTAAQVESAITGKGYITSSALSGYATSNDLATTNKAVSSLSTTVTAHDKSISSLTTSVNSKADASTVNDALAGKVNLSAGTTKIDTLSFAQDSSISSNILVTACQGTSCKGVSVNFAFTANELKNSYTLWGQSFNGSANVTGDMTNVGYIYASGTGKEIGNWANMNQSFERCFLRSQLLITTTNSWSANTSNTSGTSITAGAMEFTSATPFIDFHTTNTEASDYDARIILSNSNTLTVTGANLAATVTSDRSLKEDIRMTDCLAVIRSLGNVVTFRYSEEGKKIYHNLDIETRHTGVIYQDAVKAGIPNFTGVDDKGYGYVNYLSSDFLATLTGAVQELSEENKNLRIELDEIKKMLNAIINSR